MFLFSLLFFFYQGAEKFISHYSPDEYNGRKQNWRILQNDNGFIYVANHEGLLEYDGNKWNKYEVPNFTVRSIARGDSGKIYLGAINDFGVLKINQSGRFYYKSLSIPFQKDKFRDIWNIHHIQENIYFSSYDRMYRYNGKTVVKINFPNKIIYSFSVNKQVYVQDRLEGLSLLNDTTLQRLSWGRFFIGKYISSMSSFKGKTLIATYQSGLFLLENNRVVPFLEEMKEFFKKNKINTFIYKDDKIYIATRYNGVVIINLKTGGSKHFSKKNGLTNNYINDLLLDREANLWLATNDGINKVELSSEFTFYLNNETVYSTEKFNKKVIAATVNGLVSLDNFTGKELLVEGEYHSILKLDKILIFSGNDGIFSLDKNYKIKRLSRIGSHYLYKSIYHPDKIYFVNKSFIRSMNYKNDSWIITPFKFELNGRVSSIVEEDSANLWVGTINNGLFNVDLENKTTKNIQSFNKHRDLHVYCYRFDNEIFFATQHGLFRLEKNALILPEKRFGERFSNGSKSMLHLRKSGDNFFFRSDSRYYFAQKTNSGFEIIEKPFKRLNKLQSTGIFPIASDSTLFTENGRLIFFSKFGNNAFKTMYKPLVRAIEIDEDSLVYSSYDDIDGETISSNYKSGRRFRFEYSSPYFIEEKKTEYRYRLKGLSENWSEWTNKNEIEFTNLYEGNYSFQVQSKNIYGNISEAKRLYILINPPYYRTFLAYLLYLVVILLIVFYTGRKITMIRIIKLEEKHRLEQAELKAEQVVLQNKLDKQELRNQIASDLHDDIGSNLSSMQYISRLLLQGTDLDDENQSRVRLIQSRLKESSDSMRDIVWFVNPENDSFSKSILKIKNYVYESLHEIDLRFFVDEKVETLNKNLRFRRHFYLFFKEAVQNIIKHSEASFVEIKFHINREKNVIFSIRDNGLSFNLNEVKDGNGIKNFRKRAIAMNAEFFIRSEKGKGTEIDLILKEKYYG